MQIQVSQTETWFKGPMTQETVLLLATAIGFVPKARILQVLRKDPMFSFHSHSHRVLHPFLVASRMGAARPGHSDGGEVVGR